MRITIPCHFYEKHYRVSKRLLNLFEKYDVKLKVTIISDYVEFKEPEVLSPFLPVSFIMDILYMNRTKFLAELKLMT